MGPLHQGELHLSRRDRPEGFATIPSLLFSLPLHMPFMASSHRCLTVSDETKQSLTSGIGIQQCHETEG